MSSSKSIWLILLIGFFGCVEPYEPPAIESNVSLLVVDGTLNSAGKSSIHLTRSQNIQETKATISELRAQVSFEDEAGAVFKLTEEGKGIYTLPFQNFDMTKQHRLIIRTEDAKEYASEFVPILKSPPIDSITYAVTSENGVQVYVSTHDAENKIKYYRWSFDETWNYIAAYNSRFEWQNGAPILRKDNVYLCYQTKSSGKIVIGTTTGLSQNIISAHPLQYFEQRSEKIRFKYSAMVQQYGLTSEAYEYWLQLQKNTESLGTLFDPQPSQLTGNIKCITDLSEPVLGYFIAGSISEKRIFIVSDYLPRPRTYNTQFEGCSADTVRVVDIPKLRPKDLLNILLLEPLPSGPGPITAYSFTTAVCGDCRSAGGTTTKPDFWQ